MSQEKQKVGVNMTAPRDGHGRKQKGGGKEERKEVRREMLVLCSCDGASGVVEILQQRASPLLSNVHLILQILERKTDKNHLLLLETPPK